jgi:predicted PurR-regulated permease PerM
MPKSKIKKKSNPLTLGGKIRDVLVKYLTTQFVLMVLVGVASWFILDLLNVKYAVILGIATGTLSIVPGFGMIIATIAASLVAIFDNVVFLPRMSAFFEGVVILLIFLVLNKIVDWLLAPIFLGKVAKVNPIIVLLAVVLGTLFFGVPGAFLAVPVLLVAKTIIDHFSK